VIADDHQVRMLALEASYHFLSWYREVAAFESVKASLDRHTEIKTFVKPPLTYFEAYV
jgi:hypothetical protein